MQEVSVKPQSVSELTRQIKDSLEGNFPSVAVQGEVSNFVRAKSGHLYFTIKDEGAQLRAVCWRGRASRLRFEIEDGLSLVALGAIEVYPPRGSYQLVAEDLIPAGVGPLELAFRQLHDKLQAEGLFESERKRPLPTMPERIALVTSPTGAAVRDMLQVLSRRWPGCDVIVIPVPVQGKEAAGRIVAALQNVHRIPNVEVVIAGRGGGSLEDLWAFNEEIVARAIAECRIPVVSAVGHEIDVTIADLVADRRALTPSEAAELVVPVYDDVRRGIDRYAERLERGIRNHVRHPAMILDQLTKRRWLSRPFEVIRDRERRLDELENRSCRALRARLAKERQAVAATAARLEALNPLGVLSRGYSITYREGQNSPLNRAGDVSVGERLRTRLADGEIISRVE